MDTKTKAIVFIDAANYHYGLRKLGWEIDYEKFTNWFKDNCALVNIYFYGGSHSQKSFFDSHPEYKNHSDSIKFYLLKQYRKNKKGFSRDLEA